MCFNTNNPVAKINNRLEKWLNMYTNNNFRIKNVEKPVATGL